MNARRPDPGAASASNMTTGIPAAIARAITGTTALPSTAEIAMPSTWRWIRASRTWICGWISVTVGPVYSHRTPIFLASASHPRRTSLKKGLLIAFGTTANVRTFAARTGSAPPREATNPRVARPTPNTRQTRIIIMIPPPFYGSLQLLGRGRTRILFAPAPSSAAGEANPEAIQQHRHDDRAADHDLLPERRDAHQHHRIQQDPDERGAGEQPEDGPLAAQQAHPADHGGGDDAELLALSAGRVPDGQAGREEDAGERGERAADHVGRQARSIDVDPAETAGLGVPAHRVDVVAERGPRKQEPAPEHREHHEHDRVRHRPDIPGAQGNGRLRVGGEGRQGVPLRDHEGKSERDRKHPQRG